MCRVYSAVYFKDSNCQERSVEQPDARAVAEFDSVVRNGATCVQAEPNAPLKMSVICNSDGSVQKNYFNMAKEDPDCLRAYGPGSVIPSVTIRSGECFQWIPGRYMKWAMSTEFASQLSSQQFYTYDGQYPNQAAYQNYNQLEEAEELSTGAIIAIVIGVALCLIISLGFCVFMVRQAQKNTQTAGAPMWGNYQGHQPQSPHHPKMSPSRMPQSPSQRM